MALEPYIPEYYYVEDHQIMRLENSLEFRHCVNTKISPAEQIKAYEDLSRRKFEHNLEIAKLCKAVRLEEARKLRKQDILLSDRLHKIHTACLPEDRKNVFTRLAPGGLQSAEDMMMRLKEGISQSIQDIAVMRADLGLSPDQDVSELEIQDITLKDPVFRLRVEEQKLNIFKEKLPAAEKQLERQKGIYCSAMVREFRPYLDKD